jgi:hypothetical protein
VFATQGSWTHCFIFSAEGRERRGYLRFPQNRTSIPAELGHRRGLPPPKCSADLTRPFTNGKVLHFVSSQASKCLGVRARWGGNQVILQQKKGARKKIKYISINELSQPAYSACLALVGRALRKLPRPEQAHPQQQPTETNTFAAPPATRGQSTRRACGSAGVAGDEEAVLVMVVVVVVACSKPMVGELVRLLD